MSEENLRHLLQTILLKEDQLFEEKKAVMEERRAIWIQIKDAIRNDDSEYDLKGQLSEFDTKEAYIKIINAKIKKLGIQLTEVIKGKGDYNEDQLSIFDVENVRKEFEEGGRDDEDSDDLVNGIVEPENE